MRSESSTTRNLGTTTTAPISESNQRKAEGGKCQSELTYYESDNRFLNDGHMYYS